MRIEQLDVTVALADKREIPAKVIGFDPATDLALLKIDARDLPTMPWGDSSKLKVAEWVLAIGNPYQLNQTVTLGIVSAVGRTNLGVSTYEDFIQTDAAINPGNSGGALVNGRGELVGINTVIFSQSGGYQGIGFAVSSNLAKRVVNDLQQYQEVRRGSIGLLPNQVANLTTRNAAELKLPDTKGALIYEMWRNSSAFQAGLRPGDVVVSFNGTQVEDAGTLRASGVGRTHRQHRCDRRDPRGTPPRVEGARRPVRPAASHSEHAVELARAEPRAGAWRSSPPTSSRRSSGRRIEGWLRALVPHERERYLVDSPLPVIRGLLFAVTAAIVALPAMRLAGYRPFSTRNPEAFTEWLLSSGLSIVVIAIAAYIIIRIGSTAIRQRRARDVGRAPGSTSSSAPSARRRSGVCCRTR